MMRINDKTLSGVERVAEVARPRAASAASVDSQADTVKVSAAAASASQTAQARAAKVEQIAKAVRGGTYPVDFDRLSQAIARDELARAS